MKEIATIRRRGAVVSRVLGGSVAHDLPALLPPGRTVVVTDAHVLRLHPALAGRYEHLLVGRGEEHKTLRTVERLYDELIALGADRSTFILGIGGGVVTDVAGFVASTYMRGLRFGFVPTTLLAQIDASVGGKNGVNVGGLKNMVGTFTQPRFVLCDASLLATLPEREFRSGLAEALKAALIADASLFSLLERTPFERLRSDAGLLAGVVERAVGIKAAIVERDEREAGERRKLNLGHTLAHAIEKCSRRMNHGEAVAVGCAAMARASERLGLLAPAERRRIEGLLVRLGFEPEPPVPVAQLVAALRSDKKAEEGRIHVVLPSGIGSCVVRCMEFEELEGLLTR